MQIISPKTDFCAKELFLHEVIRKHFISDVTGSPLERIKFVRISNPYLSRRHRKQKQRIVDILVEMNGNTKVNIEIQVRFYSHWDKRNLFYLAKMYTDDLRVGENYAKLKKIISISILDFDYTDSSQYHSVYYLRDDTGQQFTDLFEVHLIELRKKLHGGDPVDDWIRLFNAQTEEELDMIHTKNAGINMAIGEVKKMSMSERMRARYEAHMKEVRDRNAIEDYLKNEALAEGRAEERVLVIEKMLSKHMAMEEIIDICDCDMQEIQEVQKKIKTM